MEKTELIAEVAKEAGISEEETAKIFDAFIENIKQGLSRGERVTISGFGTFTLAKRKAREFINPKTRKLHSIPEKFLPIFKAGTSLKKR